LVLATTEELEGFVDVLVEVGLVRHKELLVDGVLFDDHSCDLAGVSLTHESNDGSVHSIADHLLKLLRILNICEERHVEVRLLDGETGLLLVGHGHGHRLRHGSLLRHLDLLLLIHGLLLVVVLSTLLAALVVVSTAGRTVVASTTASIIVVSAALVAATVVAAVAVVVVVVLAALTVVIVKLVLLLRGVVAITLGGLVILLVVLGV